MSATASPYGSAAAARAAEAVRGRLGVGRPVAAIVLGSGLGGLADEIDGVRRVPFADVPGFPAATVAGHAGALLAGRLAGREVVALAAFPVRVMHALGARTLVVSNAAGGVRRTFRAGDLMIIADHINLMWRNPLVGALEDGDVRFPDMSDPYDRELRALLAEVGRDAGIALEKGVYCGLLGPTYETPSEVRMLERLGADAVGMSTVPETIVARAIGMRVAGVSCITNLACGLSMHPLSHEEVLETGRRVEGAFRALIRTFVGRL